jgi:dolichol-phosphate mannosyltransferase
VRAERNPRLEAAGGEARMSEMVLSVVIPAHNEEDNLPRTLDDLTRRLRSERIAYEILVVNDSSADRTRDVVLSYAERDPNIRLIDRRPPNGFGRAIRSGLEAVTGDVVVIYMADASDHPHDAVAYFRKIEEGYDCVFGSRFVKGSQVSGYPRFKLVVNRIVNKLMQWAFRCPFNDLTNAFKAYRTHVVREVGPFRACHFNITIEMSLGAIARQYHIAQIPISWAGRTCGVSKLRLKEMGRRYLSTLLKVFAETVLISDDLLAERIAQHALEQNRFSEQQRQVRALEKRVERLEQALAGEAPPTPELGRPAA